jgi:hypothetical protein
MFEVLDVRMLVPVNSRPDLIKFYNLGLSCKTKKIYFQNKTVFSFKLI